MKSCWNRNLLNTYNKFKLIWTGGLWYFTGHLGSERQASHEKLFWVRNGQQVRPLYKSRISKYIYAEKLSLNISSDCDQLKLSHATVINTIYLLLDSISLHSHSYDFHYPWIWFRSCLIHRLKTLFATWVKDACMKFWCISIFVKFMLGSHQYFNSP